MSLSDDQVRLGILQLLYNRVSDNPSSLGVDRAIIQASLQIPEQQMDQAMSFLESNDLVALSRLSGAKWTFAKITSHGLEVVENKEKYTEKYAFTQATTSQTQEQAQKSSEIKPKENFSDMLATAFRKASDQVLSANISNSDKGKIEKQLRELQKEIQKAGKADLGSIKKDWDWLRKNASFVCPVLAPVVMEAIKLTIFDLPQSMGASMRKFG